ncbi:ras-related protein RABC2a [Histomonas meleagridis]|uniref:ras-related protein RABC2a n=1 Tax=Histomonas meleagridis TaxID=135588 RepID=UPI00355998FC|nr:ras-related protein RABC2a [Histomonas meleagridis]KAH0799548.1 ras-related protein RABC2a [Histomonas meleagridis]
MEDPEGIQPTIGTSFKAQIFDFGQKSYHVKVYDTSGEERFSSLLSMYVHGSDIVVFVYDRNNKATFINLPNRIEFVRNIMEGTQYTKVLISNEIRNSSRQVLEDEGMKKAKEIGAMFVEVSCVTRSGIDDLFENIVKFHLTQSHSSSPPNSLISKSSNENNSTSNNDTERKEVCFIQ